MRLLRWGHRVRRVDGLTVLLVLGAVGIYGVRALGGPAPPPDSPFGKPMPAGLEARLDALGAGRALGDPAAPVRVVEFADYQCPACALAHDSIWPALEPHVRAGRVHYTAYHLPLPAHRGAVPAASVLECAAEGDEGSFWALRSAFLRRQAEWAADTTAAEGQLRTRLLGIAEGTGLGRRALEACLAARGAEQRGMLQDAFAAARDAGLGFTPVYAVNGEVVFWGRVRGRVSELLRAR